jgi:FtsP/CotA-like multicopper oxidase with cupredoxin domain
MEFRIAANNPVDRSWAIGQIAAGMPALPALGIPSRVRRVSLNENGSKSVFIRRDESGRTWMECGSPEAFGPTSADLGTMKTDGSPDPKQWMEAATETPAAGSVEDWEIYNFTADAHPIHLHLVQFRVLNRQALAADEEGMALQPAQLAGNPVAPSRAETGFLDTVIAYPGQVTRIRAHFDKPGRYVWHCHILEHEDNDMMRPLLVTA